MKNITLFLAIFFTLTTFAQSRKSVLKDIENYKTKIYTSTQYKTNEQQLSSALKKYFSKKNFKQTRALDTSLLSFSKLVYLSYRNSLPKSDTGYYSGIRRKNKVTFLVYVETITNGAYKKIKLTTEHREYIQPLSKNFSQRSFLGIYKFDNIALYKSLYHKFVSKEPILFSKELISKIESYNNKQTKEKKKLISGRDY